MKTYTIDMCNGPLAGKILRFALPLMAANILQLTFNAADVMVVGKFVGDTSQAAVTSTSSLINLLINLFVGLSVGVNVVVARALGRGEKGGISKVAHTAVTLGLAGGLLLMVVGELFAPLMLRLMGSPEHIIGLSVLYLRVYFIGLPGALVYNFGSALLRAQGDTKRPMYYLTLAGVVNVVLNLIFVIFFHWDVAGVAAATAISKWMSALLVVRCLMHEGGAMHLSLDELGVDWIALKEIARIGLPAGIQSSMFSLSNVTIQSAVNAMGDVVMAGSGAAANIGSFVYPTANAFYHTSMTFTGQNRGAGKPERIDRTYLWCLLFAVVFPTVVGLVVYMAGPLLLSLYTSDPEVIRTGLIRMLYVSCFYGVCGIMEAGLGVLRGLGHSVLPMIISMIGTCGLRVVWVFTVFAAVGTPQSLFLCYPLTWGLVGLTFTICVLIIRPKAYAQIRAQVNEAEEKEEV